MLYSRTIRTFEILGTFKLMNHIPKRILDFGYGSGQITNFLHKKGFNIIGLDKTSAGYRNTKKIFPECDFRLYDGLNIPFKKNSFDTIILNDVMEHIPYNLMEKLIKKLKYILEPDGLIYICVLNRFMIIESHTHIPFITWFPKIFWSPIEQIFKKKSVYTISNIYPYTLKRLKLFSLRHNLQFIDFTSVYVFHKFMNLEYIGNKPIKNLIRILKRIKLLNLFFYLACKCSAIVCILKPLKN